MTIFVVGFPKSGNTWLAKMLCQTFNAVLVDDDPAQLEVNSRLTSTQNTLQVVKSHFLPEQLLANYPSDDFRVFYIYRDFRDVSISAWFYFGGPVDRGFRLDEDFGETIVHFEDPKEYRDGRVALKNYVSQLSHRGIPNLSQFSTWHHHIETWLEWGNTHPEQFRALTYSQLRADTETHLAKALKMPGLEQFIQTPLQEVIQKESFENLKAVYKKKKQHKNASFLRSGTTGDWKNYYTREMANALSDSAQSKLKKLGFESDDNWTDQLPVEKLGPETLQEFLLYWKCRLKHILS
jgi:hypothetical protein